MKAQVMKITTDLSTPSKNYDPPTEIKLESTTFHAEHYDDEVPEDQEPEDAEEEESHETLYGYRYNYNNRGRRPYSSNYRGNNRGGYRGNNYTKPNTHRGFRQTRQAAGTPRNKRPNPTDMY